MSFLMLLILLGFAFSEEVRWVQALKLLREKSYDSKIYLYEVKKSEGAYIQSGLFQNPTLSVNYTGLNFGKNILYDTGNTLFSIRVDQPIELGNKRNYRKLSALHQLKATEYQREDVLRGLSLGLNDVYFQALSDKAYLEYLQQDLADFRKVLKIQESKQKLGFLSLIDLMKLQLYESDLENTLTRAKATYKKDLKELGFYLGGGEYEPAKVEENPKDVKLEELIEKAIQKRESIKALQEQIKSADYQIQLLKAYRIPDISVGVEYDAFGVKYKPGVGFGFSLNLPIFDIRQGDLLTALATKQQLLISLKKEEANIRKDISIAFENYQSSKRIYNSYLEKKSLMDDLLERTKKAYLLGGISTLDFLDTLRTYRAFMYAFLQARYQYLQSYYRLRILAEESYED
ncbi:outer membrane efflux protein [Hydrogenobacter thermophilus TK-6]|uniref:Heavy metal resistance protein n=1 Tax=Hydrogenobacter thermophilus (strain DSM 6534 / IAM 12695 / TK-6) TaxID=608538 RepID=D3DJY9_HYDTT|nr:TolC family protein [Hydrogenobacter thermophilus]ADO46062.1 outer membrane efflux protein [Hydrogenobacter thermophilus TK-6]BAI70141.1 heavy metal resistance protein [Hydrogenobacter thermophilus TK-6]